jgi:hypothetical protein
MNRARQRYGGGAALGPLAVYEEIKKDPDLPRSLSHDGVLLASLMEAAPRADHGPAYAAIVVGCGIRQRITLAASRMTQAAEGQDLDAALAMAAQAREELGRCQARWEALPEPMRRELPVPASARYGYAGMTRSVTAARDEIRRLREDLLARTPQRLGEGLALIAQQVADVTVASADLREPQAVRRPAHGITSSGCTTFAEGSIGVSAQRLPVRVNALTCRVGRSGRLSPRSERASGRLWRNEVPGMLAGLVAAELCLIRPVTLARQGWGAAWSVPGSAERACPG